MPRSGSLKAYLVDWFERKQEAGQWKMVTTRPSGRVRISGGDAMIGQPRKLVENGAGPVPEAGFAVGLQCFKLFQGLR